MYSLIRPLLFKLPPEFAHQLTLTTLALIPAAFFQQNIQGKSVTAMGLSFPHCVGLAAGFDKNGEYVDALTKLPFAFIEVGTVTPKAQTGNPKPRIFRLIKDSALINRMGFSNKGAEAMMQALSCKKSRGILGINIGKNKDTPLNKAVEDYKFCLAKLYHLADYFALNLSSPNTANLRELQQVEYLNDLLRELTKTQQDLASKHAKHVPLVIKCSPDETSETIKHLVASALKLGIQGIIATNTTIKRTFLEDSPLIHEQGGLSGKPLFTVSTEVLKLIKQEAGNSLTLIASGGVLDSATFKAKIAAGANLVQVYTGLVYKGPALIKELVQF
ncbi:MAG: dihydroorotate dehydrogenase (quinone) [Legionellales bacterium RIFCSPHIGHO2_12_FULL_37_14]|nr:MAG: dihydroorotate dehydrogenase (quinone) [Legionellales bacterium RIFCSPHIGHO2_12_FULL_37_14]